eukprot:Gregarina_sp_Poly_1__2667@NODE_172_length_12058_cov_51_176632_g153_i0_p1_GENE_NODE_172_length_12058_cov_51_176632_g153_i0NODE_172_length_12058_cov_51_176632_g153_i0_p1_ORF_typecomplete_len2298_score539_37HOOK/PF05622_12/0_041HOOK/PF05622_12/0_0029HOOK/PF05622_12/0_02HOOK/PF05622_12/82HOOK/PF05622_12/0_016HOOK/PF05622_12/4_5e03HOOK/PF05622_12/3_4e06HOOK/PF05622_12/0_14MAD/PF05557_13/0_0057MAD/PF05557_13/0_014MAD/PF05557_13/16MAD/PF05557_13/0_0001MAD/PF05557_13/5e02MAD/PF05557_13/0_0073MAD/PF05557
MHKLKLGGGKKKASSKSELTPIPDSAPVTDTPPKEDDASSASSQDEHRSQASVVPMTPQAYTPIIVETPETRAAPPSIGESGGGDSESEIDSVDATSQAVSVADDGTLKKKKKKGMFGLKVPKALRTGGGSKKKKETTHLDLDDKTSPAPTGGGKEPSLSEHASLHSSPDPVSVLRARLEEAEQQKVNLEVERDNLQLILQSKDLTISKLKSEVDELEKKLEVIIPESQSPKVSGKIDDLGEKLRQVQFQLDREKSDKRQIESEIHVLTQELAETKEEVERLNFNLATLRSEKKFMEENLKQQLQLATDKLAEHKVLPQAGVSDDTIQRLTDLERQVQMWKERAEEAEKQVEQQKLSLESDKKKSDSDFEIQKKWISERCTEMRRLLDKSDDLETCFSQLQQSIDRQLARDSVVKEFGTTPSVLLDIFLSDIKVVREVLVDRDRHLSERFKVQFAKHEKELQQQNEQKLAEQAQALILQHQEETESRQAKHQQLMDEAEAKLLKSILKCEEANRNLEEITVALEATESDLRATQMNLTEKETWILEASGRMVDDEAKWLQTEVELKQALADAEKKQSDLIEELTATKETNSENEAKVRNLRTALDEASTRLSNTERSFSETTCKLEQTSERLQIVETQLLDNENRLAQAVATLEQAETKLDTTSKELVEAQTQLQESRTQLEEMKSKLMDAESRAKASADQLEILNLSVGDRDAAFGTQLAQATTRVQECERQLREKEIELSAAQTQIEDLGKRLISQTKEFDRKIEETERISHERVQEAERISHERAQEAERISHERVQEAERISHERVQEAGRTYETRVKKLEQTMAIEKGPASDTATQAELEDWKQRSQKLDTECQSLRESNKTMEARLEQLDMELATAQRRLQQETPKSGASVGMRRQVTEPPLRLVGTPTVFEEEPRSADSKLQSKEKRVAEFGRLLRGRIDSEPPECLASRSGKLPSTERQRSKAGVERAVSEALPITMRSAATPVVVSSEDSTNSASYMSPLVQDDSPPMKRANRLARELTETKRELSDTQHRLQEALVEIAKLEQWLQVSEVPSSFASLTITEALVPGSKARFSTGSSPMWSMRNSTGEETETGGVSVAAAAMPRLEKATAELSEARVVISSLRETLSEREAAHLKLVSLETDLRNRLSVIENEKEILAQSLSRKEDELLRLELELRETREDYAELRHQLSEAQESTQELVSVRVALESSLQSHIAEAETETSQFSAKLQAKESKIAQLAAEISDLRNSQEANLNHIDHLQEENVELKVALESCEDDIREHLREIDDLRSGMQTLKDHNVSIQEELAAVVSELRQLVAPASSSLTSPTMSPRGSSQTPFSSPRQAENTPEFVPDRQQPRKRTSLGWRSDLDTLKRNQEEEKQRYALQFQSLQNLALEREHQLKNQAEALEALDRKFKRQVEENEKLEKEKEVTQAELVVVQDQVSALKAELDESNVKRDEVLRELDANVRQQESLQERIRVLSENDDTSRHHLVQEAERNRLAMEDKDKELSKLKSSFAEIQKHEQRLKEELGVSQAKHQELTKNLSLMKEEVSRLQRENEEQVTKLSTGKNSIEKDLNTRNNELAQALGRLKDVEDRHQQLQRDFEELESTKLNLETRLNRVQRTLDENSRQMKDSENYRVGQLEETIQELRNSKKELSQQLNAKTVALTKAEGDLSLLAMKQSVLENTNKELQNQIKTMSDRGSEMSTAMSAKELDLQRQMLELSGVKEMQSVQIASHQQKEAEYKRDIIDLKQEVDKLQERLSQAKKELSGSQIELSILERKYTDLSQENQQLKELNDELKHTSASVLQDTLKSSQQQSLEAEKLKIKTQQLERMNDDLQREVANASARIGESENAKNGLRVEIEKARQRIGELEEQLRIADKKLASSEAQVGSMKVSLQEAFKRETHLSEELSQFRKMERGSADQRGSRSLKETRDLLESSEEPLPTVPPAATIFSNIVACVDGPRAFRTVRCPEGTLEVVICLKQRLLDCLFETFGARVPNGHVLGGMFREVFNNNHARANFKDCAEKPEVLRVLSRVKKLWELGEDLRLALVQGDATLAEVFQMTRTTHADWESTLAGLRGSAEIIEERNRTLEKLAAGYAVALEEARTMAKMDREKAKGIVSNLKKQLHNVEELRNQAESERDDLLRENEELHDQLKHTLQDNSRLMQRGPPPSTELIRHSPPPSDVIKPNPNDYTQVRIIKERAQTADIPQSLRPPLSPFASHPLVPATGSTAVHTIPATTHTMPVTQVVPTASQVFRGSSPQYFHQRQVPTASTVIPYGR